MSRSNVEPAEKARRTRLINEAIACDGMIKANTVRLKELKEAIWAFAEPQIQEAGGKSCIFPTAAGVCEVAISTVITLPDEAVANLRVLLGERYAELVETTEKVSITDRLKRLITEPQPQEKTLAERARQCLRFRTDSRFTFKPAA